jgi:hypothetical protein
LKFTDEATADAISEEAFGSLQEDEEDEEVEEVYVDEDGQIISPDQLGDDYEIEVIEEEVEEVTEEVTEVAELDSLPSLGEPEEVEKIEIAEASLETVSESADEPTFDLPIEEEEIAAISISEVTTDPEVKDPEVDEEEVEIPVEAEEESPTDVVIDTEIIEEEVATTTEEMVVHETPAEEKPEVLESSRESLVYLDAWEQSAESSEDGELIPVSVGTETEEGEMAAVSTASSEELDLVFESDDDSRKIAKEIISEALDADEIISAEIDKVPHAELDVALEAFSSEETMPAKDEEVTTEEIAEEALKELDDILGSPDEMPISVAEDDEDDIEEDLDALDELFSLMASDDE